MKQYAVVPAEFKAFNEDTGVFEAIVAVFGNVDHAGDRLMPGAFDDTLAEWKASGSPIPLYFSHNWRDPDATHLDIGEVLEAHAVDQGVYVKGRIDLEPEEVFARQVFKRMKRGTLKEFSFSYVTERERPGKDGARELLKVKLLEVGPTFKGVNPATQLLSVKAGRVLSKANEKTLRDAVDTIQKVLASVEGEAHSAELSAIEDLSIKSEQDSSEKSEEKSASAEHAPRSKHAELLQLWASDSNY